MFRQRRKYPRPHGKCSPQLLGHQRDRATVWPLPGCKSQRRRSSCQGLLRGTEYSYPRDKTDTFLWPSNTNPSHRACHSRNSLYKRLQPLAQHTSVLEKPPSVFELFHPGCSQQVTAPSPPIRSSEGICAPDHLPQNRVTLRTRCFCSPPPSNRQCARGSLGRSLLNLC